MNLFLSLLLVLLGLGADGTIQVPPDDTGKKVDMSELTVAAQTVERQRINIADPTSATGIAAVDATLGLAVNPTDRALRDMGKIDIAGFDVALPAGGNLIGSVDINSMPNEGQQTMANSISVAIASNQSGIPVTDNAGSLTVDNGGTFAVQDSEKVADNAGFTDGTTKVQPSGYIFDEVAGTALTENDAAAARIDSKRAQVLVIEDETTRGRRATVTAANALKVDASGVAVPVTDNGGNLSIDDGGNSITVDGTVSISGTVTVDSELPAAAALADNTANPTVPGVGAFLMAFDGTNWDRVQTGAAAGGALKVDGSAVTQPVSDGGGLISVDDGAGSLTVDGSVSISAVTPGTGATNLGKAEDTGHTSGDVGVMPLAVRKDTGASLVDTDLDYAPLQVDSSGNLRVNVAAGGAGDGSILDGVTPSIKATVFNFTNSKPLAVVLRDTNGDYVTAGGGTEYTEDVAAPADPIGKSIIARRRDTLASEVDTDGDNIAINATAKGQLHVFGASDTTGYGITNATVQQIGGTDGYLVRPLRTSPKGNLKVDIDQMPALNLEGLAQTEIKVTPGDERFTVQGSLNATPVPVQIAPRAGSGLGWMVKGFAGITTTIQTLKNVPGEIGGWYIYNPNVAVAYVQIFDTTGNVTLGTTSPTMFLGIPGSSAANLHIAGGISFFYGVRFACTTTATGNTAPGSGLDINFWYA